MTTDHPTPTVHAGMSGITQTPLPDPVDPIREVALQAAAHWHIGSGEGEHQVVAAARVFEAYLRGDDRP